MNAATRPALASFSEFAKLASFKPSYVTQLKRDGRLVLSDDGKAVRVDESLARIRDTADPSKAGVAARHAAQRGAGEVPAATVIPPQADDDEDDAPVTGSAYHQARTRREHYLALAAQRDYEVSIGNLLQAEDVKGVVADAGVTLRGRLEALADMLAPQLAAEPDEARCRALIAEAVEHALEETVRSLGAIVKASGDKT